MITSENFGGIQASLALFRLSDMPFKIPSSTTDLNFIESYIRHSKRKVEAGDITYRRLRQLWELEKLYKEVYREQEEQLQKLRGVP